MIKKKISQPFQAFFSTLFPGSHFFAPLSGLGRTEMRMRHETAKKRSLPRFLIFVFGLKHFLGMARGCPSLLIMQSKPGASKKNTADNSLVFFYCLYFVRIWSNYSESQQKTMNQRRLPVLLCYMIN